MNVCAKCTVEYSNATCLHNLCIWHAAVYPMETQCMCALFPAIQADLHYNSVFGVKSVALAMQLSWRIAPHCLALHCIASSCVTLHCIASYARTLHSSCEQSEVITHGLQGYNAAIIAYGQTGTGKTFTMEGAHSGPSRGIIPRAIEDVFMYIENDRNAAQSKFLVRASYLQIYNEVRHLYRTAGPLTCFCHLSSVVLSCFCHVSSVGLSWFCQLSSFVLSCFCQLSSVEFTWFCHLSHVVLSWLYQLCCAARMHECLTMLMCKHDPSGNLVLPCSFKAQQPQHTAQLRQQSACGMLWLGNCGGPMLL